MTEMSRPCQGWVPKLELKLQPVDSDAVQGSQSTRSQGCSISDSTHPETAHCFLVVRNINRWDDDGAEQPYALAVALWRDEGRPELHAELQTRLEAEAEIPVEIEIEP